MLKDAPAFYRMCVFPALWEEIVFRGTLLLPFSRKYPRISVLATSVLFALIHGGLYPKVYAFFSGLILGAVVIKTGKLWLTILLHLMNNALVFFFILK